MARFEIPAENVGRLADRLAKLNRKAIKLGTDPIVFNVIERVTKVRKHEITAVDMPYVMVTIEVSGATPKLEGWSFLAKVEPTEQGDLVSLAPAVTSVPMWAHDRAMDCDHCGRVRGRKEVFIVANDEGKVLQVGRSCLADFIGGASPESLAARAEWLMDVSEALEEGFSSGGHIETIDTVTYLTAVVAISRIHGFVSREQARNELLDSTSEVAWRVLKSKKDAERYNFEVNEADAGIAAAALVWIDGLEAGANNYLRNLQIAAANTVVDGRSYSFVASLVAAYNRHMGYEVEKALKAKVEAEQGPAPVSEFVGQVGDKVALQVTVTFVKEIYTNFGVSTLVKMADGQGNVLTWFASGSHEIAIGAAYKLTGTVKKHEVYRDAKQTLVTRCKLV